jgi:hypothetical protein
VPKSIIKHHQYYERKSGIVFTAYANSAASPISIKTMNAAAIASRLFSTERLPTSACLDVNVAGDGMVVQVDAIGILLS